MFDVIQWISWVIGVGVSIANGLISLFTLDRIHYIYSSTKARLRSEFFQYAQLTGRQSGYYLPENIKASHENQQTYFANEVEKIMMTLLEEEQHGEQMRNRASQSRPSQSGDDTPAATSIPISTTLINEPVDDDDENQITINSKNGVLFPHSSSKNYPPTPADHARARTTRRESKKKRTKKSSTPTSASTSSTMTTSKNPPISKTPGDSNWKVAGIPDVEEIRNAEMVFDISSLRELSLPSLNKSQLQTNLNPIPEIHPELSGNVVATKLEDFPHLYPYG